MNGYTHIHTQTHSLILSTRDGVRAAIPNNNVCALSIHILPSKNHSLLKGIRVLGEMVDYRAGTKRHFVPEHNEELKV